MNIAIASLGLLPSIVVLAWGTIKFRNYYEVQRTRTDYLTMVNATLIQLVAFGHLGISICAATGSHRSHNDPGCKR